MAKKPTSIFNIPVFPPINFGGFIHLLITFFENSLPFFPEYFRNAHVLQNLPDTIEGENRITVILCQFLTSHEKNLDYTTTKQGFYNFQFVNQVPANGHRSSDIGVFLANIIVPSNVLFVIEAKRLPTLPIKTRQKEYVIGDGGGIERFKKQVHGQELRNNISSIIGYIQNHNSEYWQTQINSLIDEQIEQSSNPKISWSSKDILIKDMVFQKEFVTKFNSIHQRINLSDIHLIHYWIDLTA